MPAHDDTTIGFYSTEAKAYVSRAKKPNRQRLAAFLARLPAGGTVLELGCGGGHDSEAMLAGGFDVTPTDGTPEMAREAETRLGRRVRVLLFEDLAEKNRYDGVWANACLLHVPREDLPAILDRIHAALRSGGVFYASYKSGSQEGRDRFDRYYNYPSAEWLREAYGPSRWAAIDIATGTAPGYFNEMADWLYVTAVKL